MTDEPEPDSSRAAMEIDHLGRPAEFIEAEDEEARKHWDARLWKPID
ncbi:MAG: hypothetical protein KY393_08965 [Actinobacteria bacterium]|nr:hypothetical protein [Actinomycetota bacterium]